MKPPYATKVTVKVATANGTALAGKDDAKGSATLTLKPDETVTTVKVRLLDDDVVKGQETFSLVLSKPVGAPIVDGTGVATIAADPPLPVVAINDAAAVTEPTGPPVVYAMFTVTLSKAWGKPVVVKVSTVGGSATKGKDFLALTTSVTFKAGETSKIVKIRILKDALVEGVETFTVVLSSPVRATLGKASGVGTINPV